jgi:hypothetical protein
MAVPTELGQLEAYSVRRRTSGKLDSVGDLGDLGDLGA